jgi:hypothetical protein
MCAVKHESLNSKVHTVNMKMDVELDRGLKGNHRLRNLRTWLGE